MEWYPLLPQWKCKMGSASGPGTMVSDHTANKTRTFTFTSVIKTPGCINCWSFTFAHTNQRWKLCNLICPWIEYESQIVWPRTKYCAELQYTIWNVASVIRRMTQSSWYLHKNHLERPWYLVVCMSDYNRTEKAKQIKSCLSLKIESPFVMAPVL